MSEQEAKVPLGFTARTDKPVIVTSQQFFDLMKAVDVLSNIVSFIKQQNVDGDNIRYYFEEDLVDATDEQGNAILGQDGKPQKSLRPDFWN
jgi:hypothetical protein